MSGGAASRPERRATVAVAGATAVSRATGFGRTLVMAAVLGTTLLGNAYQAANALPTLLFELLAAGALQAVLVPTLVAEADDGGDDAVADTAGAVLGVVLAGLIALAVAGVLAARPLAEVLTSGVADPARRAEQASLVTSFLRVFLPQLPLYGLGLVATAALHARRRFVVPAVAPVLNNLVVVAAYGAFWWQRDGRAPSLQLSTAEVAVLAGGTTLAVLAFTSLPALACRRAGIALRPRWRPGHPAVTRLVRDGAWAAAHLGAGQVLLAVVLVVANRTAGGVVAWQVAFTLFLLPHALLAVPVATTAYPALVSEARAEAWAAFRERLVSGVRVVGAVGAAAALGLAVLAWPLARLALFGEADAEAAVARAVVAFAPGLVAYGAFQLLTRASYALGDVRTPALAHGAAVAGGVVAAVLAGGSVSGQALPAALAAIHSVVYVAAAVALAGAVRHRLRRLGGGEAAVVSPPTARLSPGSAGG